MLAMSTTHGLLGGAVEKTPRTGISILVVPQKKYVSTNNVLNLLMPYSHDTFFCQYLLLLPFQNSDMIQQGWAISLHAYVDLRNVSPAVFLFLLKECYVHGTCKASVKFCALQHCVHQVLYNSPRPGPAIFVARCLYVLPIFESYCEGLSHLIISAFGRFLKAGTTQEDLLEAKSLATQLFVTAAVGNINHDEKVLIKILEVFDIRLVNIETLLTKSYLKNNYISFDSAKAFVEQYIFKLLECQSCMTAVTLLERFSIRESGESVLREIVESKDYRAAEKWAAFMGKSMICTLVHEYVDRQLIKHAYDLVKKKHLHYEFPEVYHKGVERSLKKLAEKACWDVAEMRAKSDRQLLEYLVYLAMEASYPEKVDELCDRYSLKGFMNMKEAEVNILPRQYLHLDELAIENIIWVDEANQLNDATCHIEACKVVGLDCEWKPNYEKGSKPNKVSIMQISSEKMVFILDLIKLYQDVPDILDDCLSRILHSPGILKLGMRNCYNFQCDFKMLNESYGNLDCFKRYEMLLDIQNVFKEAKGGLSGLSKSVLGIGLNKTRRNSNWEHRPLSENQLEYAALDAAVLIHIFRHVRDHSPSAPASGVSTKMEWKSHIMSYMGSPAKTKKQAKSKKKS